MLFRSADFPRYSDSYRAKALCDGDGAPHAHVPGRFHNNPDYTVWYGWSEMRRDLTEIQSLANEMRQQAPKAAAR